MRVAVQYGLPRRGLPSAQALREWARAAGTAAMAVTVRIVGAPEGLRLNSKFRAKRKPTNVLSFSYGEPGGDVVLCHPVVAKEARAQDKTLAEHYAHLVVHGVLHLRGHDHRRSLAARRMENLEIRILRRAGFRNPYRLE